MSTLLAVVEWITACPDRPVAIAVIAMGVITLVCGL